MNYRGDDLDLRTPQGRTAPSEPSAEPQHFNGPRQRSGSGRADPIWVDDTVMAVSNHAFELARAHRSAQVRLEHLLHALCTLEAAAEYLEARGYRVTALRRESGLQIATEIPVQMANGSGAPRRSDELEAVLRGASERAGLRNAAASVDDLIDAMLDVGRDSAAISLLRRNIVRQQESAPPVYARPRVEKEPARERVRMPAGSSFIDEPSRVSRPDIDLASAETLQLQSSRIEQLETAVRQLHSDLISERKALQSDLLSERKAITSMLQDVQRQIAEQREDSLRTGHGAGAAGIERLKAIELTIDSRIAALEQTVQAAKGEGARNWSGLAERIRAFEAALTSQRPQDGDRLDARLAGIDQTIRDRLTETGLEIVQLGDRMKSLEDGQTALRALADQQLNQGLSVQSGAQQGIAGLLDRQRSEIAAMVTSAVAERVGALQPMLDRLTGEVSAAASPDRLRPMMATLDARQGEQARHMSAVAERIGALEHAMTGYVQKFAESAAAYDQDLGEIQQAMLKLNSNQQTLAGAIDQWRLDGSGDLGIISNRTQSLEQSFTQQLQAVRTLASRIDGLYRSAAERAEKRSRFWYWLLGTNHWIEASWPRRRGGAVEVHRPTPPAPPPPQR